VKPQEFFALLSGLALYEELRWRLRDEERLRTMLDADVDVVASWRRRGEVPQAKRDFILKELLAEHLLDDEKEAEAVSEALRRIEAGLKLAGLKRARR
jgi:bacterioferritin (cytochrome b1)